MSAVLREEPPALQPMRIAALSAVLDIEQLAYEFPWTRGNFIDSLAAGYDAMLLRHPDGELLGYFVAMPGVDEMHLLNITVAPGRQGHGHARAMLDALVGRCRERRAATLWLEVRLSNLRARRIYERYGFREIGLRKGYYPAAQGRREDAIVMSLEIRAVHR